MMRHFGLATAHNWHMPFDLPEEQLERTERLVGARFPESYRQAIMHCNGGERLVDGEVWELIPIRDERSPRRILRTTEDLIGWTDNFRMWRTWPKGAVSIATNGVGDALLLLMERGRIHPEVYVWWHETGSLEKVASDFGDMLSP